MEKAASKISAIGKLGTDHGPRKKVQGSAVVFHPFFLEAMTTSQETSAFPDWWCQTFSNILQHSRHLANIHPIAILELFPWSLGW